MKKLISLIFAILTGVSILAFTACKPEKLEFTFYCPDGAPALSIAGYINAEENFGTDKPFNYNVVSAKEINNAILKEGADFVIMPINSATKLYKENGKEDYKMVSVITHGNFYIMGKETLSSMQDLIGKVVFVPQSGKVPDLTLQASLKQANISYKTGDSAEDGVVTLNYKYTEPSDLVKFMIASKDSVIGLIPEPAATNLSKKGYGYQISLQSAFDQNSNSYPQAVLLAKQSVIKDYPEVIEAIEEGFNQNFDWVKQNSAQAVAKIKENFASSSLAENIPLSAIQGCNVYWQKAQLAKAEVNAYIQRIRQINPDFINQVGEEFYL
jgi:ABC-type nitrate/sulfonate/bicarbonate transport system substrate-binding protein